MVPIGLVLKMSIGSNLNFIEKKDKDFNQSSKKIKKYNLNDEQKKAYDFLDNKDDKFMFQCFKEQQVQEKHLYILRE